MGLIEQLLFFLNPFGNGWIAFLDAFTFILVPYLLLKTRYNTAWWRALLFYIGFIFSQIVFELKMKEYVFEVLGVLIMIYACGKTFK